LAGSFVYERRRKSGLTQQELADLVGVGKRFIVELERGKPSLRLDKVDLVLRAFGKQLGPVDIPRRDGGGRGI
jgi:y4mF family transcriptional regulator